MKFLYNLIVVPLIILLSVKYLWRAALGGWFVFRDAPDYIVNFYAKADEQRILDSNNELVKKIYYQACSTYKLRNREFK